MSFSKMEKETIGLINVSYDNIKVGRLKFWISRKAIDKLLEEYPDVKEQIERFEENHLTDLEVTYKGEKILPERKIEAYIEVNYERHW